MRRVSASHSAGGPHRKRLVDLTDDESLPPAADEGSPARSPSIALRPPGSGNPPDAIALRAARPSNIGRLAPHDVWGNARLEHLWIRHLSDPTVPPELWPAMPIKHVMPMFAPTRIALALPGDKPEACPGARLMPTPYGWMYSWLLPPPPPRDWRLVGDRFVPPPGWDDSPSRRMQADLIDAQLLTPLFEEAVAVQHEAVLPAGPAAAARVASERSEGGRVASERSEGGKVASERSEGGSPGDKPEARPAKEAGYVCPTLWCVTWRDWWAMEMRLHVLENREGSEILRPQLDATWRLLRDQLSDPRGKPMRAYALYRMMRLKLTLMAASKRESARHRAAFRNARMADLLDEIRAQEVRNSTPRW